MSKKNLSFGIVLISYFFLFRGFIGLTQPGSVDLTFNGTDNGYANGDGFNGSISDAIELTDGSIIFGGSFSGFEANPVGYCARMTSSGEIDNSFLGGQGANSTVNVLQLQPDGKILMGGFFTTVEGQARNYVARILANGSIDPSFGANVGPNAQVRSIDVLGDGKILIGGNFTTVDGVSVGRLAKLNSNGSLDATFNIGTGANGNVRCVKILPSGKILVAGEFTSFNGVTCGRIVMLNSDGSIDSSFNTGVGANFTVMKCAIQTDGKILVGGQFSSFSGVASGGLIRLNANGSMDTPFNIAVYTPSTVTDFYIQSDGKIIITGYFFQCCNGVNRKRMARVNQDGTIDNSFVNAGYNQAVQGLLKLANGNIMVFGDFTAYGSVAIEYANLMDVNGGYLPFIELPNSFNEAVFSMANAGNGKIFVAGQFSGCNGVFTDRLVRLNSDGSVDGTFPNGSYSFFNGAPSDILITSTNHVILAGSYNCLFGVNSTYGANLLSMTSNGILNWILPTSTWTTYYGGQNSVQVVKETSTGSLIIGGSFSAFNGSPCGAIARLSSSGVIDNTFKTNTGTGFNNIVTDIEILGNGKIFVVGYFTSFNGTARNGVCLLNSDGTLDTSFNPGTGANTGVFSCQKQADGKLLIAGEFTTFNGATQNRMARLLTNGTLDNTFSIGSGPSGIVYEIDVQTSGKVLILGDFSFYNGVLTNDLARLNSDGSLDVTFNTGSGVASPMTTMLQRPNGNILVGGFFTAYKGTGRNRIVSINGGDCGAEICNGLDDDCDGVIDDWVLNVYYADEDGDGFGNYWSTQLSCNAPNGYVVNFNDCDDSNFNINESVTEICNFVDDDCDSFVDEGFSPSTYYLDLDGDGFGEGLPVMFCQVTVTNYVLLNTDCDDSNNIVYPGAPETCNNFDDDCDGTVDNGLNFVNYYNDQDGDGYGAGTATNACSQPANTVANNTDCNDNDAALNSISAETCNNLDDDCDGTVDNGLTFVNYYNDQDGDGYGAGTATNACSQPANTVANNTDCNDGNASIMPGATEICGNNIDEDCSGSDLICPNNGSFTTTNVVSVGNYGTGSQTTLSVNFVQGADNVESPGAGIDRWFQFTAQANAMRIELIGNTTVGDDNDVALYDYTTTTGQPLIPLTLENDVTPSSMGISTDGGNEILYYDQLEAGSTYWICVRNLNNVYGTVSLKLSYLRGSAMDIGAYTNYTNTYSSTCQNFKCKYKPGASYYTFNLWNGNTAQGPATWIYSTTPTTTTVATTVVQLGRLVGANINNAPVQHTVKVNAHYALKDAYGNTEQVVGYGTTPGVFTMNTEADLNLRTTDRCPVYKSPTSGSMATNRSVCGTTRYIWELTMSAPTAGLPQTINGPVGGSRVLAMTAIPGISNNQQYNVSISSLHVDQQTQSNYGTSQCMRTYGFAGAPVVDEGDQENNDQGKQRSTQIQLYPNPNGGDGVVLNINGMEGETIITITDAMGRGIEQLTKNIEGDYFQQEITFQESLSSGLYQMTIKNGGRVESIRMMVAR